MRNAAGDGNCDEYIPQELKDAGIEVYTMSTLVSAKGEVPTKCFGLLNGWVFKRAWYYWVAKAGSGVALSFDVAETLHEKHGQDVRVAGHCCAPAPREWYKESWHVGVPLYHVDSQEGLNALAAAIRGD